MGGTIIPVILIMGCLLSVIIIVIAIVSSSRSLTSKFRKLGNPVGRHINEIFQICGNPVSSSPANGGTIYQWALGKEFISLIFNSNNFCTGIVQTNIHF